MRLLKHEWIEETIKLDKSITNVLVLENHKFYRDFVLGLQQQIDEDIPMLVFSEDLKELKLSSCAVLLTDLFDIPIDDKKCSNIIYKDIEKAISDEQRVGLGKLNQEIASFLGNLTMDYPIPLTFDDDIKLTNLLKVFNVRPEYHPIEFIEALVTRIKIINSIMKKDLIFVVNLHDLLRTDELIDFYKEMRLLQIDIVVIDSHEPKTLIDGYEKGIVIDKDLCEILK